MSRKNLLTQLEQAPSMEVVSGLVIKADENLAEYFKAALFYEHDDLYRDVFDEGSEMELALSFSPGRVKVSVPRLEDSTAEIEFDDLDDHALAGLLRLASGEIAV